MVREADGSIERLYPNDARLRNLTYASPIKLEMTIVEGEKEKDPVEAEIGTLPIMLMSKVCNLSGMTSDEMVVYGEDPMDPGGILRGQRLREGYNDPRGPGPQTRSWLNITSAMRSS